MVLASSGGRVLESQLFNEESTRFSHVRRELQSGATWDMEVKSQIGPLALSSRTHILDCAHVEGNEGVVVNGNQDAIMVLIHIDLAWLQVLGELPIIIVGLNLVHLLHLLLLCYCLELIILVTLAKFL